MVNGQDVNQLAADVLAGRQALDSVADGLRVAVADAVLSQVAARRAAFLAKRRANARRRREREQAVITGAVGAVGEAAALARLGAPPCVGRPATKVRVVTASGGVTDCTLDELRRLAGWAYPLVWGRLRLARRDNPDAPDKWVTEFEGTTFTLLDSRAS